VSSHTGQIGLMLHLCFRSSVLALWINQGTKWFSGEPPETLRTRCSLHQSPLMTRLPCSPGSALVLTLNQETVHNFILLFLPLCGPHLTPLATGSLEPSLLVFSTPGVTTPSEIILYYHLNHSIWSLSNNKESSR
jgi:hypothetical protein